MALSDVAPRPDSVDPAALLVAHLDYYRGAVARKVAGLTPEQLRRSLLPSGWAPLEMLNHLVHMERRWLADGATGE